MSNLGLVTCDLACIYVKFISNLGTFCQKKIEYHHGFEATFNGGQYMFLQTCIAYVDNVLTLINPKTWLPDFGLWDGSGYDDFPTFLPRRLQWMLNGLVGEFFRPLIWIETNSSHFFVLVSFFSKKRTNFYENNSVAEPYHSELRLQDGKIIRLRFQPLSWGLYTVQK
jgi:hypothetical protein